MYFVETRLVISCNATETSSLILQIQTADLEIGVLIGVGNTFSADDDLAALALLVLDREIV